MSAGTRVSVSPARTAYILQSVEVFAPAASLYLYLFRFILRGLCRFHTAINFVKLIQIVVEVTSSESRHSMPLGYDILIKCCKDVLMRPNMIRLGVSSMTHFSFRPRIGRWTLTMASFHAFADLIRFSVLIMRFTNGKCDGKYNYIQ